MRFDSSKEHHKPMTRWTVLPRKDELTGLRYNGQDPLRGIYVAAFLGSIIGLLLGFIVGSIL